MGSLAASWVKLPATLLALWVSALSLAGTASAEDGVVPDLLGVQLDVAQTRAVEAGIELRVERLDWPRPPDEVFDQIPGAGAQLAADRRVLVQVSDGLTIPNLVGLTREAAEAELARMGFSWESTMRPVTQVAKGIVGDLIPPFGTQIDPTRQVVFLVVSDIPGVLIPQDIFGLSHTEARRRLEARGLIVSYDIRIRSDILTLCPGSTYRSYEVTGSRPEPGTEVLLGSNVELSLNESSRFEPNPCTEDGRPL